MKWVAVLFGLAVLAVVLLAVVMRLVASDPARWHALPADLSPGDGAAQAVRVVDGGTERLAQLAAIAETTPRTTRLAGSVEEGMITYVTRSAFFGFPDYTTMGLRDGQVVIFARARFGKSDLGVNAARLADWLSQV